MIFIDTGAFVAMFHFKDRNFSSAQQMRTDIQTGVYGKMITSNYVLDELITLLKKFLPHKTIVSTIEIIRSSSNIQISWITEKIESITWEYFKKHQDKEYSFTDCTSFVIMDILGIKKAFSYDKHFSQAGFVKLP